MRFDQAYQFDDDEAVERLTALTDYWSRKYGVKTTWTGERARISGRVRGVKFDGVLEVGRGRMKADMKAGFLAEKLGAKGYVDRKLTDYLDPRNTLDELRRR